MLWIIFWNECFSYILPVVWNKQNIESDWFITFSNSLHGWESLCLSIHTDLRRGRFSFILCEFVLTFSWFSATIRFDFFMVWCSRYGILKTVAIIMIFRIYCCFFISDPFRRISLWSTTIDGCFLAHFKHSWKIIKNEVANPHGFFKILYLCKNESKHSCLISTILLPIITTLLLLLQYIASFSILCVDEIKLGFIVSCIFHLLEF